MRLSNKRIRIPQPLQSRIYYKSANSCAVCRRYDLPTQIHHIDQDPSNNVEGNLILLCTNCHDEAHTHHDLSQNLTQEKLRYCKSEWEKEVQIKSINAMTYSTAQSNLNWTYFNFSIISRSIITLGIKYKNEKFKYLKENNIINKDIEILNNKNKGNQHFYLPTFFDNMNMNDAHILNSYYQNLVNMLIEKVAPYELDAMWRRKDIKSLIIPNSYIYFSNGMYFNTVNKNDECETRKIHMQAKGIRVEGYVYTNYMFGSSSHYKTFRGHSTVTGFYLAKHIETDSKYLRIHVTPIALGTGTWDYLSNTPYFLRKKRYNVSMLYNRSLFKELDRFLYHICFGEIEVIILTF
jgi:hypothetical protein